MKVSTRIAPRLLQADACLKCATFWRSVGSGHGERLAGPVREGAAFYGARGSVLGSKPQRLDGDELGAEAPDPLGRFCADAR
jgi:hypothetical protein